MKAHVASAFEGVLREAGLIGMCDACGGLRPGVSRVLRVLPGDPDPTPCPSCGLLVDKHGLAFGHRAPDGSQFARWLDLRGPAYVDPYNRA
jgi:hypothetical protein